MREAHSTIPKEQSDKWRTHRKVEMCLNLLYYPKYMNNLIYISVLDWIDGCETDIGRKYMTKADSTVSLQPVLLDIGKSRASRSGLTWIVVPTTDEAARAIRVGLQDDIVWTYSQSRTSQIV